MIRRLCTGFVIGLVWTTMVYADPPDGSQRIPWLSGWNVAKGCQSPGCRADDYVRKPCPPISSVSYCGEFDDFGRKHAPCMLALPRCGGLDDYRRKSVPYLLCPPLSPFLQCGMGIHE
jgi:hypothetical protein